MRHSGLLVEREKAALTSSLTVLLSSPSRAALNKGEHCSQAALGVERWLSAEQDTPGASCTPFPHHRHAALCAGAARSQPGFSGPHMLSSDQLAKSHHKQLLTNPRYWILILNTSEEKNRGK